VNRTIRDKRHEIKKTRIIAQSLRLKSSKAQKLIFDTEIGALLLSFSRIAHLLPFSEI
jgi:hypothetical protein